MVLSTGLAHTLVLVLSAYLACSPFSGTLLGVGLLVINGALYSYGLLLRYGTLMEDGSLCHFGTLFGTWL